MRSGMCDVGRHSRGDFVTRVSMQLASNPSPTTSAQWRIHAWPEADQQAVASTFSNSRQFEMYAKPHLLLRLIVIRNICQKVKHFLESRARTWDCGAMGREVAGL